MSGRHVVSNFPSRQTELDKSKSYLLEILVLRGEIQEIGSLKVGV
jgi:hypothetical protein